MRAKINFDNIAIVLHRPRFPENIGAAARAMRNMGLNHLIIVDPENFDFVRICKMATHCAVDIVEKIDLRYELREALEPFQYVVGTTARLGKQRTIVKTPSAIAKQLVSISQENCIAIVFGPEDRGLANEDIQYCHALVNIPTARFSSLNLAQAVMVMCYEIFAAELEKTEEFTPRLATRHELDGMYDQLKEILVRISYINHENPNYWMNNLRRFFARMRLRAKEVSIIRGLCRQVNWYGEKCYNDGLKQKKEKEERFINT